MADSKNLKFIHLGADASMASSGLTPGAIYFEPKTGRIHVATSATEYEPYGGGSISDASFTDKKLTITFNDGKDDIVLDFSDVASAEGVSSLLGDLRKDVTDLQKGLDEVKTAQTADANNIKTIMGEDDGSIKKAVADAKTAIVGVLDNNDSGTLAAINDELDAIDVKLSTIMDEDDGSIKKAEADAKKYTDDKIGDLKGKSEDDVTVKDYVDNAIGGVTTANTSLDGRVTALEGLHADKEDGAGKMTVADEAAAAVAKVVANAPEVFNTLKEIADWIGEGAEKTTAAAMLTDISTLKTTVGDASEGLVKNVNDNTQAISEEKTRATGVEAELRNDLGDSTAEAGTDNAFARIKALESAQSEGNLMWARWTS